MQRFLKIVLLSLLLLVSINSSAEEVEEAKDLVLDGKEGVWLPKSMADRVLSEVETVPLLEKKISDLEALLSIRSERIENLKVGISWAEKAEEGAYKALFESDRRAENAEKKLNSWYRHPAFLISLGCVLTIGVEIGSISILKSL